MGEAPYANEQFREKFKMNIFLLPIMFGGRSSRASAIIRLFSCRTFLGSLRAVGYRWMLR